MNKNISLKTTVLLVNVTIRFTWNHENLYIFLKIMENKLHM